MFFGEGQNACPGVMRPCERSQDVRPRRPNGAIWKGKVMAGEPKTQHLGQPIEAKGRTSDN